jgi:Ni/Co efflux regulator RcnB
MHSRSPALPRLVLALAVAFAAATALAQADNSNSNSKVEPAPSFSTWMMEHPHARQDRVAREPSVWEMDERRRMQESRRAGGIDLPYRYHTYPVDAGPLPVDAQTFPDSSPSVGTN